MTVQIEAVPQDLSGTAVVRPPIGQALAAFVAGTAAEDVPAEVRRRALHHILDATGIALVSAGHDFAHRTLTAVRGLAGAGTGPVIGMPARLPPRDAALVNGVLCHGLDFDDTHIRGVVHPTASVFPAALSAAQIVGASGREMVTAYVLGVEVAARLGMVARGGFHQVGFHPTGVIGAFASTLTAGRLMGLSAAQLEAAQGIVLSMASGSLEFLEDGAWNKRMHPGWAAQAGITAAAMAREGFVGVSRPYEGRFGLFNTYLGRMAEGADLDAATAGLGTVWELPQTAIKPFPACHFTHGSIDAALALAPQIGDPSRIRAIEVLVPGEVIKTVCEPEANKKRPANSYDAQFSIPFLVSAALLRGRVGFAELEAEVLADPAILALAQRVTYAADPDSPFPLAYSGEVRITLEDGQTLRHREHINRGAADRPLSDDDIVAKYRTNTDIAVSATRRDAVAAAVLGLDDASDAAAALAVLSSAPA